MNMNKSCRQLLCQSARRGGKQVHRVQPRKTKTQLRPSDRDGEHGKEELLTFSADRTKGNCPLCHNKWTENIREPVMRIMDVSCCRKLSRKKMNEERRSSVGKRAELMSPVIASLPLGGITADRESSRKM